MNVLKTGFWVCMVLLVACGGASVASLDEVGHRPDSVVVDTTALTALLESGDYETCSEDEQCHCVFSLQQLDRPPHNVIFEPPEDVEIVWMRCFLSKRVKDYKAKAGLRVELRLYSGVVGHEPVVVDLDYAAWGGYLKSYRKKTFIDIPFKLTGSKFSQIASQMSALRDESRVVEVVLYARTPIKDAPVSVVMGVGHIQLPTGRVMP